MIRVLLVDDQSLLRMGFRLILEAEPDIEVVGEAADGASGVVMTAALHPDVVLMDVRMPGMDGIAATASIIAAAPGSKVLILTTFDLDQYVFAGLKAGASGFMLKDAPLAELLTAHPHRRGRRRGPRPHRDTAAHRPVRPATTRSGPAAGAGRRAQQAHQPGTNGLYPARRWAIQPRDRR